MALGFKQRIGFLIILLIGSTSIMAAEPSAELVLPSDGFWSPSFRDFLKSQITSIQQEKKGKQREVLANNILDTLLIVPGGKPLRVDPKKPTTPQEKKLIINALLHTAAVLGWDKAEIKFNEAERRALSESSSLKEHIKVCKAYYLAALGETKEAQEVLEKVDENGVFAKLHALTLHIKERLAKTAEKPEENSIPAPPPWEDLMGGHKPMSGDRANKGKLTEDQTSSISPSSDVPVEVIVESSPALPPPSAEVVKGLKQFKGAITVLPPGVHAGAQNLRKFTKPEDDEDDGEEGDIGDHILYGNSSAPKTNVGVDVSFQQSQQKLQAARERQKQEQEAIVAHWNQIDSVKKLIDALKKEGKTISTIKGKPIISLVDKNDFNYKIGEGKGGNVKFFSIEKPRNAPTYNQFIPGANKTISFDTSLVNNKIKTYAQRPHSLRLYVLDITSALHSKVRVLCLVDRVGDIFLLKSNSQSSQIIPQLLPNKIKEIFSDADLVNKLVTLRLDDRN